MHAHSSKERIVFDSKLQKVLRKFSFQFLGTLASQERASEGVEGAGQPSMAISIQGRGKIKGGIEDTIF
jgi:hypothetical protein